MNTGKFKNQFFFVCIPDQKCLPNLLRPNTVSSSASSDLAIFNMRSNSSVLPIIFSAILLLYFAKCANYLSVYHCPIRKMLLTTVADGTVIYSFSINNNHAIHCQGYTWIDGQHTPWQDDNIFSKIQIFVQDGSGSYTNCDITGGTDHEVSGTTD